MEIFYKNLITLAVRFLFRWLTSNEKNRVKTSDGVASSDSTDLVATEEDSGRKVKIVSPGVTNYTSEN